MSRLKYILVLLVFMSAISACQKETLSDGAPSLIGDWVHYSAEDAWEIIYIDEDGTGRVEWYTNGKLHKDTKTKTWYVDDNRLFLGKTTFSLSPYDIDAYPVIAFNTYTDGFDTITIGERFIQLDDLIFTEKE